MARVFGTLVRLVLLGITAFVLYALWLVDRLDISREAIERRARSVETNVVPSIVGGAEGRSFDAQLEFPLYLPADRIPDFVKNAIVASEDQQFWWHPGVNPIALMRATLANAANWWHGTGARSIGASTITMQFVKNCLLSQQQSYDRKFNEIVLAVVVSTLFSKSEVLTMYLNTAYFGAGAYGIEVAARKFFGRSVGYEPQINLYEAALLAKSVKSPSTINPISNRRILDARARGLIRVMATHGETAGLSEGPRSPGNRSWSMRPYLFRDLALRFLLPAGLEDRKEPVVLGMTIDPEAQLYAELRAGELLDAARPDGYDSSAILVLKRDGAIAALATGHPYDGRDVIIQGKVSPGSTLKPFLYLCALEHGARPEDKLRDSAREFRVGWAPRNFDGRFMGKISVETALLRSRNPPAIELYDRYGWRCFDDALKAAGITLRNPRAPTAVLGSENVSLLSLAGAYASLAAGGRRIEPYAIQYARDSKGRTLYNHDNPVGTPTPVAEPLPTRAHCALMKMLRKVVSSKGTGKEAAFSHPAWGKTGTSTGFRDALFVGFTAHYVAVIWLGRQAPGPVTKAVAGGDLPAKTFKRLMATLHQGLPVEDIPCSIAIAETQLAPAQK